jgi:hypothetical protein
MIRQGAPHAPARAHPYSRARACRAWRVDHRWPAGARLIADGPSKDDLGVSNAIESGRFARPRAKLECARTSHTPAVPGRSIPMHAFAEWSVHLSGSLVARTCMHAYMSHLPTQRLERLGSRSPGVRGGGRRSARYPRLALACFAGCGGRRRSGGSGRPPGTSRASRWVPEQRVSEWTAHPRARRGDLSLMYANGDQTFGAIGRLLCDPVFAEHGDRRWWTYLQMLAAEYPAPRSATGLGSRQGEFTDLTHDPRAVARVLGALAPTIRVSSSASSGGGHPDRQVFDGIREN